MDSRRMRHEWYETADEKRMLFIAKDYDDSIEIPAHYEVCDTCEGRGSHVNPSVDENGLSAEDFDQDPDLYESYMTGMYDVSCNQCHGKRVVMAPNFDAMTPDMVLVVTKIIQDYYEDQISDYETRRAEDGYQY